MTDRFVIDTDVLVNYQNGDSDASAYLDGLVRRDAAVVHPVCAAEMLHGALDSQDMMATVRFLSGFRRVPVKASDLERCLWLLPQYRLSFGTGWADCVVAATCLRLGLPIVTLNDKHFRPIRGLRVIRPY